jgi:hypothetical protein
MKFLTDVEFVTIWMKSNSLAEMAKKTKLVKISIQARATRLRRLGVKLPKFSAMKKTVDVAAINKLIKKLSK